MCQYCDNVTKLQAEYVAQWPNFCRKCGGAGETSYYEDVAGDGGSCMQMSDYCEHCVGKGICPRCGVQNGETWCEMDVEQCPACGWVSQKSEMCPVLDMCPEEELFDDSILFDETELLHDAVERSLSHDWDY